MIGDSLLYLQEDILHSVASLRQPDSPAGVEAARHPWEDGPNLGSIIAGVRKHDLGRVPGNVHCGLSTSDEKVCKVWNPKKSSGGGGGDADGMT